MRAFIDQINNRTATLLLGDDEKIKLDVPVEWLPEGIGEGLVLRMDISIDEDATADAKSRVKSLIEKLGNNP